MPARGAARQRSLLETRWPLSDTLRCAAILMPQRAKREVGATGGSPLLLVNATSMDRAIPILSAPGNLWPHALTKKAMDRTREIS